MVSSYNDRPGKLFDGLEHIRLSIILWNSLNKGQNDSNSTVSNSRDLYLQLSIINGKTVERV